MSHTTQVRSHTTRTITRTGTSSSRRSAGGRSTRPHSRDWAEIAVLALIAILLVVGAVTTSYPRAHSPELAPVKIQSGDTLWTLAKTHPVDGLTTQQVVAMLSEVNGLSGSVMTPGELILLPADVLDQRVATR